MTQQNLLELAKQGDARAIAILMNSQLNSQGMKAKVSITNNCLMVIAESINPDSTQPPSNTFIVNFVRKGIIALNSKAINRVVVWGKVPGNKAPAWREDFKLSQPDITNAIVEPTNNFKAQQTNIQPKDVASPKPQKRIKPLINTQLLMRSEIVLIASIILVFAILIYAAKEIFTVKQDDNDNIANRSNFNDPSLVNT